MLVHDAHAVRCHLLELEGAGRGHRVRVKPVVRAANGAIHKGDRQVAHVARVELAQTVEAEVGRRDQAVRSHQRGERRSAKPPRLRRRDEGGWRCSSYCDCDYLLLGIPWSHASTGC